MTKMHDETAAQHPRRMKMCEENEPLLTPTYSGVKYSYPSIEQLQDVFQGRAEGYVYSRVANPTVRQLELILADMQKTQDCIAVGSGAAAITGTLLGLLKSGDHVISFLESYRPTRIFVHSTLKRFGVSGTLLSIEDKRGLEEAIAPGQTKVIIFESPTNPVLKIADMEHICSLAKRHNIITILDNTFAGLHNHQDFPVDIYVHSLTKFAVGTGSAMGGAILSRKEIIDKLRGEFIELGPVLDPRAANSIICGLRTYYIRYRQQSQNAMQVAKALSEETSITDLSYPGLESHKQHALARKQLKDFGAMIAFDLRGDAKRMSTFIKNLKIFKLAGSLGSTESLVAPSLVFYGGDLDPEQRKTARISEVSLRLSIGLESPEDLISDLKQALQASM